MHNFEVRNEELEKLLNDLGQKIKSSMPQGYGFTLLISSYGQGGSMFYISSVDRSDVLRMMREFIQKHELDGTNRKIR